MNEIILPHHLQNSLIVYTMPDVLALDLDKKKIVKNLCPFQPESG